MRHQGIKVEHIWEDGMTKMVLLEDLQFDLVSQCSRDYKPADNALIRNEYIVKAGFICDGASIPRMLWSITGHPFESGPLRAAIFHDAACQMAKTQRARRAGDSLFIWIMEEDGVPWLKRYLMFLAVRAYGFWLWPISQWLKQKRSSMSETV